jgi:hypothetical protein
MTSIGCRGRDSNPAARMPVQRGLSGSRDGESSTYAKGSSGRSRSAWVGRASTAPNAPRVILLLAVLLCGCRERVRIHTEEPVVRETTCACTRWETQPYLRRVCHDEIHHYNCSYVPDVHRVAVDGMQRCEVTTTRYSWRYADEPVTNEARPDIEVHVRALEACR